MQSARVVDTAPDLLTRILHEAAGTRLGLSVDPIIQMTTSASESDD